MLFAALLAAGHASLAAGQNFDTVQIRTQPLARGVYMLQGSGGNIGLAVGDEAVFVVDDQFAPLTPKILAAIAAITPRPVRFVLNTHWHFDHTGGNENLGKAGGLVVAHENVRRRMALGQFIEAVNRREPPASPGALPVVTFTEGVTFHINGDSVVVRHVPPAHTDGDAIVFFTRANVIHMGDLFVSAGLPLIDLSSGGSIHGFIGAAETGLSMANAQTQIIPGHGPLASRARLQAYREMLIDLRARIGADVAAGKTVEQVLAADLTAPYREAWPGGHERFVRLLHQELSRR
jgi:glyoxylase-like metal-dependent hydrolase (beta-lactamase superfamily II)